jgi:hypothetical protein
MLLLLVQEILPTVLEEEDSTASQSRGNRTLSLDKVAQTNIS